MTTASLNLMAKMMTATLMRDAKRPIQSSIWALNFFGQGLGLQGLYRWALVGRAWLFGYL